MADDYKPADIGGDAHQASGDYTNLDSHKNSHVSIGGDVTNSNVTINYFHPSDSAQNVDAKPIIEVLANGKSAFLTENVASSLASKHLFALCCATTTFGGISGALIVTVQTSVGNPTVRIPEENNTEFPQSSFETIVDQYVENLQLEVNTIQPKTDSTRSLTPEKLYGYSDELSSPAITPESLIQELVKPTDLASEKSEYFTDIPLGEILSKQPTLPTVVMPPQENAASVPDVSGVGGLFLAAIMGLLILKRRNSSKR